MTIRQVLLSMGYREAKPKTWLKPVGYVLFEYKEETSTWTSWFKCADGPLAVFVSHPFISKEEDFLAILRDWEAYTRIDVGNHNVPAEFHFLTAMQRIEEVCG